MTTIKTDKPDFRTEVTNTIIDLLSGGLDAWRKPWNASNGMPCNGVSKRRYNGGNAFWLQCVAMKRGYADNRYCTYKQSATNGWQVRKGEKGIPIEYWEVRNIADKDDQALIKKVLIHRVYTVFNYSQIDGTPELPVSTKVNTPIQAGEDILKRSGANITHGGNSAHYAPTLDVINMPLLNDFDNAESYYATALHELGHWTGHASRLDRFGADNMRFGSEEYAIEELRAELCSCMLQAETGLAYDANNSAAYVQSWLKALRNDKNLIFKVSSDASKMVDFILNLDAETLDTDSTD